MSLENKNLPLYFAIIYLQFCIKVGFAIFEFKATAINWLPNGSNMLVPRRVLIDVWFNLIST